MTPAQKQLIKDLLTRQYHLVKTINHKGNVVYKLFDDRQKPLKYVASRVAERAPVWDLLKMNKKRHFTLNLSRVRQLDGRNWIKKQYKIIR